MEKTGIISLNSNIEITSGTILEMDEPTKEFILDSIEEWKKSKKLEMMKEAERYYKNESDIINTKRYYIDRKGAKKEAKYLSNSKLSHPFMRKLTNQKVNYLLSKPITLQCKDEKSIEVIKSYLGNRFDRKLKNIGKKAVIKGISWLQVYYDEEGKLRNKIIPSEEVIASWKDGEHEELNSVIRYFIINKINEEGKRKQVEKIEYYNSTSVYYFEKDETGKVLIKDPDYEENPTHHFKMKITKDEVESIQGVSWNKVPFIPFKYNSEELSLLTWIKPLIDDYDKIRSTISNIIHDFPNSIKVIKGYSGKDKEEFTENLNTFRTAFVDQDGDIKELNAPIDVEASKAHWDTLKKDIYESGNGVDTQEADMGNLSGQALKFRYTDLDTDTDDLASEITFGLQQLFGFIKADILASSNTELFKADIDIDIVYNTDNITNESELIIGAKQSQGLISEETIIANHPWVTDVKTEMERLKKEEEEKLKLLSDDSYGQLGHNHSED